MRRRLTAPVAAAALTIGLLGCGPASGAGAALGRHGRDLARVLAAEGGRGRVYSGTTPESFPAQSTTRQPGLLILEACTGGGKLGAHVEVGGNLLDVGVAACTSDASGTTTAGVSFRAPPGHYVITVTPTPGQRWWAAASSTANVTGANGPTRVDVLVAAP